MEFTKCERYYIQKVQKGGLKMERTNYNYSKLRGRIKEICGTEGRFAKEIGRTQNYLTKIFQNKSYLSQKDIETGSRVLKIDDSEIPVYFFNKTDREVRKDT